MTEPRNPMMDGIKEKSLFSPKAVIIFLLRLSGHSLDNGAKNRGRPECLLI
jgi:hypothetical protein